MSEENANTMPNRDNRECLANVLELGENSVLKMIAHVVEFRSS